MDFSAALSAYLCFLAIVMVTTQLLFICGALHTLVDPPPASLALSHSVLLSHDDKGPESHGDGSEDELDDNHSVDSSRC